MAADNPSFDTSSTLLPPRLVRMDQSTDDDLECSLHYLPKPLMREFGHVFNEEYLQSTAADLSTTSSGENLRLLAIPTNQRAREDLVAVGDHIEQEKDRLLNVFISFGKYICEQIRLKGYWADYIDPCSGLPMISLNCNKVYSEVDGMECLLNYKSYNAGFCKILTHPKWGSAVYPATIFAHAPVDVVKGLIESLPRGATA
ncbi:hypothetical protein ACHAWU_003559 [Discostella pseudostelligera]|uniref:Methylmalonic aciduria and homocystinuria type D protein n=1 Tax=Discostella pseudostelligera TaxID=259834 RepID=A0ABD3N3Z2_9STRA